jgi:ABC-2 type transport system permease protein
MNIMFKSLFRGLHQTATYFWGELKESVRDSGTIIMFLVGMIIYPVLYSLGYFSEVVRDIPVAMVDMDHSSLSRQLTRLIDATEQVNVTEKPNSIKEAEELFYAGKVAGVYLIDNGFEKDIYSGRQGNISVYSDAGHFLLYKQVLTSGLYGSQVMSGSIEINNLLQKGKTLQQAIDAREPLNINVYNLYNPNGGYATFIVPGILIIVIQQTLLIGIGILWAKHRERKSYHYLKDAVNQRWAGLKILLGQSSAYVFLYLFTSFLILGLFYTFMKFPDKSGFLPVLFLLIPYLFTVAFLGMTVGVMFKKRVHALLFMVFISPSIFFISGAAWPAGALPPFLRTISYIFPSTPMINAFIRVRIFGAGLQSVYPEYKIMLIQMSIYFATALLAYYIKLKTLKQKILTGEIVIT